MTIEAIKQELARSLPGLEALRALSYEVPNRVLEEIPHPLVSVRVITFRHLAYLRRCVESILAQRTTFPFEVLIGEDHSDDGTRELAFQLAKEHPGRIRLITADRNVGVAANGYRLRMAARGEFTALCEGDDHWLDENKLQDQVDTLLSDPQAVGCFTNAWNERDGSRSDYISVWLGKEPCPEKVFLKDIIGRNFIPTASLVYRTAAQRPLDPVTSKAPLGDQKLHVNLLTYGHYRFLPRYTVVREVHAGGVISMKSHLEKLDSNINSLQVLGEVIGQEHQHVVRQRMAELLDRAVRAARVAGDRVASRNYLERLLATPDNGLSWKRRFRLFIFAYAPDPIVDWVRDNKRKHADR